MVKELKAEITVAVENINTETLTAVMENFSWCLTVQGSHIEHKFTKIKSPMFY
jgi:hypothetical protein